MIEARVDDAIIDRAFEFIKPKASIAREMIDTDRLIAFVEDEEILGVLLFSDFDGWNIWVHLALDTPRVCQRRHIKLMYDYMFNQCKAHRATAMCINGYDRNERLLAGVGFKKEGVIRQAFCKPDGTHVDGALYGILKGECRWV